LHHYLVGQLSLSDQDFKTALENFAAADELIEGSAPLVHAKLADLYLRFGELDKALAAASKAVAEDPSNPNVLLLHAGVLESMGRDAEAEPEYKKLIEEYPGKFDAYVLLSNLYVRQKKYQAAIDLLVTLERRDPSDSLAHYCLGRTYEEMEKFPQAEAEYAKVFESDPNLTNGAVELLRVLLRMKKTDKAKALCERMLQKDQSNAIARKVLGHLMLGESKLDEALKHLVVLEGLEKDASDTRFKIALIQMEKRNFEEATRELSLVLATNPEHGEARYYLASIYAGTGRQKEALKELDHIKKSDPIFVKARTFAAFLHRQNNELERARDGLNEAREIEPDNKNLLLYYVLIMRELNEFSEAQDVMRQAVKKDPNDERLLFNLGLVLHEGGEVDEALELMERVLVLNPKNSDAMNYLAYGLVEKGVQLERARTLSQQALEMRPNDPFYLDTFGWIQFKSGLYADAEETLGRAMSFAGEDMVIIDHYAQVLEKNDKLAKAVSLMKAALETKLDEQSAADVDTQEALARMQRRLKAILEKNPELAHVEKTALMKKVPSDEGQTSFDFDREILKNVSP
jgi:tetratricopeptide (TPR) repeat protein